MLEQAGRWVCAVSSINWQAAGASPWQEHICALATGKVPSSPTGSLVLHLLYSRCSSKDAAQPNILDHPPTAPPPYPLQFSPAHLAPPITTLAPTELGGRKDGSPPALSGQQYCSCWPESFRAGMRVQIGIPISVLVM